MSTYYTLLTDVGAAKLANAAATETKVDITTVAVGDGGGAPVTLQSDQTSLVNQVWSGPVTRYEPDPSNPNQIIIEGYIPAADGGWTIREVGIYDADGDLIAVGNYPDTPKPTTAEGSGLDVTLRTVIAFGENSDCVQVVIDPTIVIASRQYVAESIGAHNSDPDAHPDLIKAEDVSQMIDDHNSDEDAHPDKAEANLANVDASDVIEKVKEVDGNGSGLDADLLRGKTPTQSVYDVLNAGAGPASVVLAHVIFNAQTLDIIDAMNVSGVSREGTGEYTVYFDRDMPYNYTVLGTAQCFDDRESGRGAFVGPMSLSGGYALDPYQARIQATIVDSNDGSKYDPSLVCLAFTGVRR